ncbi:hypothetical protein [Streptantibioticus silvisoli]|uniref:C1q domain-containing protein n=1 Tax=Streptantibioticus silvisoli TaxID=2705255 RepID=A0ABT6W4M5_9ACTN|nr:hypothetical protein [Streptantibioticus silvisoli]MDI5965712.1 hypothetical protein [Streptantibioticus silvisoli]
MGRTAPLAATEAPGNYITSALWNAQVQATLQWMFGTGSNGVPRFKGYATVAQSVATGTTNVSILLDSEVYDSDGGHSTTTQTSRYTVQVAGTYLIHALGGFVSNTTGTRELGIMVNGVSIIGSTTQAGPPSTGNSWVGSMLTATQLNVGDYVEMQMWQSSGSTLATATTATTAFGPMLALQWISN